MEFFLTLLAAAFHELGHTAAIVACGKSVRRIKIRPVGFTIEMSEKLLTYNEEIIINSAGPFANILLFLIFNGAEGYPGLFSFINLALFIINMLPVGMLDGGKILKAILMKKLRYDTAYRICEALSLFFTLLLWLASVYLLLVTNSSISLYIAAVWLFKKMFFSKNVS